MKELLFYEYHRLKLFWNLLWKKENLILNLIQFGDKVYALCYFRQLRILILAPFHSHSFQTVEDWNKLNLKLCKTMSTIS